MKRDPSKPSKILPRPYGTAPSPKIAEPNRGLSRSNAKPARKSSRPKMTAARKSARGTPCLLNVADVCIDSPPHETTVLVHFRWLGECGTGIKPPDSQGCPGCSACNTWTDSPTPAQTRDRAKYESDRNFYAARALARLRNIENEKGEST